MKKLLALAIVLASLLRCPAAYLTTNPPVSDSEIIVYVTNADYTSSVGYYTNTFNGTNWPAGVFYSTNLYFQLIWATNGVWWLDAGDASYTLAGGPTNFVGTYTPYPGLGLTHYPVVSIYTPSVPPIVLFSGNLTNFWLTNGSVVTFKAGGWNNSVTASNDFSILVGTNTIFTSPPTVGNHHAFSLTGTLGFNGTNLATAVQYASGDPGNPISSAFTTISNFSITTPSFAINLDATGDTNLLLTAGEIRSASYVPGSGAAALDLVPRPPAITNFSIITTNTAYTNPPSLVVTSVADGIANVSAVIPSGAPGSSGSPGTNGAPGAIGPAGTNTVTAYNLTNAWLSSFNNTVFATNNIVWGTSNFIGTFSTGFSSLNFNGGQLGGSDGSISPTLSTNVNQSVFASTNGDVTWFLICTNGGASTFTTTNSVDLSVSGAGGGLGELEVYLIDHPELLGRTNGGFGQNYSAQDPVNPQDVATKNYTDTAIANSAGGQVFVRSVDTNGVTHSILSVNGTAAIDVALSQTRLLRALATSGTNILIYINVTNLTTGWTMQSTTNIGQFYSWTAFTNWTSVTTNVVGGVSNTVTFTIPKTLPGQPMRYFDPQGQKSLSMTISLPTTMGFLSLTNYTVTSSTNSTLNLPIGSVALDTNYLYMVAGTNAGASNWRRLAWPTNAW